MPRWERLLARMVADTDPRNYTYEEAARVLLKLDYELAPHGGTSHRKWRKVLASGKVDVIGLVESGRGCLKPCYIRDMVRSLQEAGLIPAAQTEGDADAVDE